jgi:serine/alanine adding enzyme
MVMCDSPTAALVVSAASAGDAAAWDRFVTGRADASGYHVWRWRDVFERAFGHEPIYFAARVDGEIVGILPLVFIDSFLFGRTLTSLPFVNYGGIVADSNAAAALLDAATRLARERRCRHIELRHVARRFPELPVKQHKVAMRLRVDDRIWGRLDRKVRNQIRKARKSRLTVARGGVELADDFYTVFARNMRDLGTPVYARRFFDEVLRVFPERTRYHVVRLGDAPVAAGLTYRTNAVTELPWASSIRDHNTLCPNHLLYWSVIEAAIDDRSGVVDFGRSSPGEGPFNFKEQWGAEARPLHWEYRLIRGTAMPNASPTNPRFRLAIGLWKRLPLAIAGRIGPHIVRGIP